MRAMLLVVLGCLLSAPIAIGQVMRLPGMHLVAQQQFGRTSLMQAAMRGDSDDVRALVRAGASVDATDDSGDTALLLVTWQGCWPGMVDVLLELGASIDIRNQIGRTPLMNAAKGMSLNHQLMLEGLLKRGASINRRDDLGKTALFFGAATGIAARSRALLAAGADVGLATRDGDTPLMVASRKGSADHVQLLLDAGANPRATNKHGHTALWEAAFYDNAPAMMILLQAGADPNSRRTDGSSVLMAAAVHGNIRAVDILLAEGADADARMPDGRGVLMLMVFTPAPSTEILSRLLAAGASPNWTDQYGRTALKLARGRGMPAVEQLLVQAGGKE